MSTRPIPGPQEEGNALAAVLFGDYNPAGTWVKSIDDLPPVIDYNIRNNRTEMYFKGQPLCPFGNALSYTTFAYSNLRTMVSRLAKDGQEVVQLYVRHMGSKVERPIIELKGFRRLALRAGETKTVQLPVKARDLAYWDAQGNKWVIEIENVEFQVGASSADIRQRGTIAVQ